MLLVVKRTSIRRASIINQPRKAIIYRGMAAHGHLSGSTGLFGALCSAP